MKTPRNITFCACGVLLSEYHLTTCKYHGLVNRRHNCLVECVRTIAREAGCQASVAEVRAMGAEGQGNSGADGEIRNVTGPGEDLVFDVTVVHSERPDLLTVAKGKATERAEQHKHALYDDIYQQLQLRVVPVAIEVYGSLGKEAATLLRQLAARAKDCYPHLSWSAPTFTQRWSQMISCCLNRETARNVLELVLLATVGEQRAFGNSARSYALTAGPFRRP